VALSQDRVGLSFLLMKIEQLPAAYNLIVSAQEILDKFLIDIDIGEGTNSKVKHIILGGNDTIVIRYSK